MKSPLTKEKLVDNITKFNDVISMYENIDKNKLNNFQKQYIKSKLEDLYKGLKTNKNILERMNKDK